MENPERVRCFIDDLAVMMDFNDRILDWSKLKAFADDNICK